MFSLESHGIDTVLFDQMVGTLELEDQQELTEALEMVPEDRRDFIAKTLHPYLRRYEESTRTERDSAMIKHANIGRNAILHAVALTHLPYSVPLLEMTTHQSEIFLNRVITMVFFYPLDVSAAFHRDETFVNAVCGAGMNVLAGDTGTYYVEELAVKGDAVRNAICIENLVAV
jgi:hypothetical protein